MIESLHSQINAIAPTLVEQGLSLRHWRDDSDYERMTIVLTASRTADGLKRGGSADELREMYAGLAHFQVDRDLFLVSNDMELVGYAECRRKETTDKQYPYRTRIYILPEWRGKGIENELLALGEEHLRPFAKSERQTVTHWFEFAAADSQPWLAELAQANGYVPVRRFANMVCFNLKNLPEYELPPGIETRPVQPDHLHRIWEAEREAFLENWEQAIQDETEFQRFSTDPVWDFGLWQIAWDGDEVVGAILNFVNKEENQEFNLNRGYTENIIVRKPWRRRGIAKALLVKSMKMFRDLGFTQTALGVDTENATGAFKLYREFGYELIRRTTMYRKPVES